MTSQASDLFVEEMLLKLLGRNDEEIIRFFDHVIWRVEIYSAGYELDGPIYLVLDNSVIQDFKHTKTDSKRALRALSYIAFCRFVFGWSDRPTSLAVSPVAVYEYMGRKPIESEEQVWNAFTEIRLLLQDAKLELYCLGFKDPKDLLAALLDVQADAEYLARYAQEIDVADWQLDLKSEIGVKIPIGIAFGAIPDDMPLRYFDSWYVKYTYSSRIEQLIIKQSQHNPDAKPISSGKLSELLADLNDFKRGIFRGLGDIDLLQICDVTRQYKQHNGYVLLGQTVDRDLSMVLGERHRLIAGAEVKFGQNDTKDQIKNIVNFMTSNPFAIQQERAEKIRIRKIEFVETLAKVCQTASKVNSEAI